MNAFNPSPISVEAQDDLRADARAEMFFTLRNAFKKRSLENGLKPKDLSDILGKNKSYISRILNGTQGSVDFETLTVFMHALGYHLPLVPVSHEDLSCKKANFDARPLSRQSEAPTHINMYEARYSHIINSNVSPSKHSMSRPPRVRATYDTAVVAS